MVLTGNLITLGAGDSDGDSQPDLLEIALGSNPTSSADRVEVEASANPVRVFAYQRRSDITWISHDEQFSDTLSSWSPPPASMLRTSNPVTSSFEEVVFSSVELPHNQFFRVGVRTSFP